MTSLNVAVQMDPLETIGIAGDSTFALMLSAQARGHKLFHYLASDLTYGGGRVRALARKVTVRAVEGDHFTAEAPCPLDLGRDTDVVLMRQDPPFDIGYITATYLLERIAGETLVVNDPRSVRDAPEKLFVLDFAQFMPPTLITRSLDELRAFHAQHGEIVVKPLHGNGGAAVFRIGKDGANLGALAELFGEVWREPYIAQAFLPAVAEGESGSCSSMAKSRARSTACQARARSAPTSPPGAPPMRPSSVIASARFAMRSDPNSRSAA